MDDLQSQKRIPITSRLIIALAACACLAVYVATAYRTITWWDSSEYTLAAVSFGIPHPPGSLLLVILGSLVNLLPLGISSAFKLNLFAGFLAAVTTAMIAATAGRLMTTQGDGNHETPSIGVSAALGLSLAVLGFGFSHTAWTFAIRFTPYILTPLFTVLILLVLIRWWEVAHRDHSWRWLALGALLIGLDFSVHRTNALLLPGILAWVLICNPRTLLKWRTWVGSISGLLVGLSLNLVMIPMAMRNPLLNANDPRTLSRLWDYIRVKQAGGGFLLSLYPRNSDILESQFADWVRALATNFFTFDGPLGVLGAVTGLLALLGLLLLLVRQRKIGIAYLALLVLTVVTTVLYFNIPETFFRPFDRHYLPTFVLFMMPAAYAAGLLMKEAWSPSQRWRVLAGIVVGSVIAIGPTAQFARNYDRVDGSDQTATHDIASGMLNELAPNAILFTNGDNDTFPLWCLQEAESIRPDVSVINIPLLHTDWYAASLAERDPNLHFSYSVESMRQLSHLPADTVPLVVTISLSADAGFFSLPDSIELPTTFDVTTGTTMSDSYYLVGDQLLSDIIAGNFGTRPIYFASTVSSSFHAAYRNKLRHEGLCLRLMPIETSIDPNLLRKNLTECYDYSAIVANAASIEESTGNFGVQLAVTWLLLADAEHRAGNSEECLATLEECSRLLPPDRLSLPPQVVESIQQLSDHAHDALSGAADSLNTAEM